MSRHAPTVNGILPAACLAVAAWSCCGGCGGANRGSPRTEDPGSAIVAREDWSYGRAKGTKLTSEHYVVYTTCTAKPFVSALPGFLETCWGAYAELLPAEALPPRRLEAYLFKSRWEWERFTDQFNPARADVYKRIQSGGYSERGITVSHYSSQRVALSVLAHEGLHQYIELTRGATVPPWLNEGLATYFEGFDLDPRANRPVFTPEANYLRTRSLRDALVAEELIPLKDLLAGHAGEAVQKGGSYVRRYYSQVWSLVLFMMQPEKVGPYRQRFLRLLREAGTESMDIRTRAVLATDTDGQMSYGEAVFRAYVSDDLETFQKEYEAYLRKLLRLQA